MGSKPSKSRTNHHTTSSYPGARAASARQTYPGARAANARRQQGINSNILPTSLHPGNNLGRNNGQHTTSTTSSTSTNTSSSSSVSVSLSQPGAFSVTVDNNAPPQLYRVTVPSHIRPGESFQAHAGNRTVRVNCPANVRGGTTVQITVPGENVTTSIGERGVANLTCLDGEEEGGGAVPMTASCRLANSQLLEEHGGTKGSCNAGNSIIPPLETKTTQPVASAPPPPPTQPPQPSRPKMFDVKIPSGVTPGSNFRVSVEGNVMLVQCPLNARVGSTVRITPPVARNNYNDSNNNNSNNINNSNNNSSATATSLDRPPAEYVAGSPSTSSSNNDNINNEGTVGNAPPQTPSASHQMFEVTVPNGVRPNQRFTLMAGGQRCLVNCPPNSGPGRKIRFKLPVRRSDNNEEASVASKKAESDATARSVSLSYNVKDDWIRTVRVTDMKFQWIRTDGEGNVLEDDVKTSYNSARFGGTAYVRRLKLLNGNDERMRAGLLSLVPASMAEVDSCVLEDTNSDGSNDGGNNDNEKKELVGYVEIAEHQSKTFEEKTDWFQGVCKRLTIPWSKGHIRIKVRRSMLLQDSVTAVMSLSRNELRNIWRFEFIGEAGLDAGGVAREWFQLVSEKMFDPDMGLWLNSVQNQMCMKINPASKICCPQDHLLYYRFLGRVMGKALFDSQLVAGHMVQYLYKHMLGWPLTFDDMETVDEDIHRNLKQLAAMEEKTIEFLCLDFTVQEERLGVKEEIELVKGGKDREVNGGNVNEYLEANFKYRLLENIRPQLTEILLGFFDVIPEPLLTVFDFQELELVLCGMPTIDLVDWKSNTLYAGEFFKSHQVCKWFWQIVEDDFDDEMKARLLQFVTGTSGVPSRGFSVLQGNDGNIKKFTIDSVPLSISVYPRSHTCFNRIDLPLYTTKKEFSEKLKEAVTSCATGFSMD